MAVTYGFYNSINKDRAYNAVQISQMFDGIINDGIYDQFEDHLEVREGTGMSVIVKPGRAWLNHTWTYNDSDLVLSVEGSDFQAMRIDAVVLKIDQTDSARTNTIYVHKGDVSDHPKRPTFENTDAIFYYPLAFIFVDAQATEIPQSKIENNIGANTIPPEGDEYGPYVPPVPFVTGIIDHVTAEELLRQWVAEWDEYKVAKRAEYEQWVAEQESDMETWEANQKSAMETWEDERMAEFISWRQGQEDDFDEWFQHLKDELDDNQAAHLQNEIDDIVEKEFNRYYDLLSDTRSYEQEPNGMITKVTSINSDEKIKKETTFAEVSIYVDTVTIAINVYSDSEMQHLIKTYTKTTTFDRQHKAINDSAVSVRYFEEV